MNFVKEPHTAIFSGPTGCGKTQLLLDMIEADYKGHFDNIIILCPTIKWNVTYLKRSWVWKDEYVFIYNTSNLCDLIANLSSVFSGEETLFILDDCITNTELDKTRSALLNLAISGRHRKHSVWMLTQRYNKIPLTVRDQLKQLFIWFPKNKKEFELVLDENFIIDSKEEIARLKQYLKDTKHGCLFLRMEHPRGYELIN